jgi:hypothetical protein
MLLFIVGGCASYSSTFATVERQIAAQHPDRALAELEKLEKHTFSSKDEALYLMNKAMLLRMQGKFDQSNQAFEQAKALIDKLDAISVTEQTGTLLVNDATRSYLGEDFERALIHLYEALNYLELGDRDAARVEALQVDQLLIKFGQENDKAVYTEDAFVRYLTGMIYEELGEWSNAMIAYRKSYEAYLDYKNKYYVAAPSSLKHALLRLAEQQGLSDELKRYKKIFGIKDWKKETQYQQSGELVLVMNEGLAPVKREHSINVLAPQTRQLVRIATPYYLPRVDRVGSVMVEVKDKSGHQVVAQSAELVEDVESIAVKTLESQMGVITTRAIARAVAKYKVTSNARKKDELVGFFSNVANVLTERADTRSWTTLPQKIYLGRLPLADGSYTVTVKFRSAAGHVIDQRTFNNIAIRAGRYHYLSLHRVSPDSIARRY